jgi:type II secretory pathway predicted ATPase ExeA
MDAKAASRAADPRGSAMDFARFGLQRRPFPSTPDSSLYYPATPHEQVLAPILRAIHADDGLALVIGEPGVGKTLLGQILLERLGDAASAFLPHSHYADRSALLQSLLYDLGLPYDDAGEQTLRLRLTDHALKTCASGKRLVVVIDEAHLLGVDLLEELRLLGNLEAGRKAFQVVCLAQHKILETLKDPRLTAWNQRVAARLFLPALTVEDAVDYLVHHLRICGGQPSRVIDDEALEAIARASHGIPRLLNQTATQAFTLAESAGLDHIDAECALEALGLLGLDVDESAAPIIDLPAQRRSA